MGNYVTYTYDTGIVVIYNDALTVLTVGSGWYRYL